MEDSYFKLREKGDFKSLKSFKDQTERMCLDAIRHLPKSFMYVLKKTDKIIDEAFTFEPQLIKHLSIEEQTDEVCVLAIRKVGGKTKKKVFYEKVWRGLRNRSDIVCLEYARQCQDLPEDFFEGKNSDFVVKLLTMNANFLSQIPKYMTENRDVIRTIVHNDPEKIFLLKNPEDWMIRLFIEVSSSPLVAFLTNIREIPFRIMLQLLSYNASLSTDIQRINLEAFDELILRVPVEKLYNTYFLFSRICEKIVNKYPFLYYEWTGRNFKLFLKSER